jgi:hypothetical protein
VEEAMEQYPEELFHREDFSSVYDKSRGALSQRTSVYDIHREALSQR